MRKIISLSIVVIIIMIFAGCNNSKSTITIEFSSGPSSESKIADKNDISLIDIQDENAVFTFYKENHDKFRYNEEYFSGFGFENYSSESKTVNYYNSKYFHPVFVRDKNSKALFLLVINDKGYLYGFTSSSSQNPTKYFGYIHHNIVNGEEIMSRFPLKSLVYNANDNKITLWSFGKAISSTDVIKGASYVGYSEAEFIYLFHSVTDVYGFKILDSDTNLSTIFPVAHNVTTVIDCNYCLSSDAWGQPLFLMQNGTIKAYIGFDGEGKSDDASHLMDIMYEGSYNHH